jgi:hypothetical protein
MKEVAEIDSSKETNIKEIKITMVEHINNDNHTVIFQNGKLFCLYIRNELERKRMKAGDLAAELPMHRSIEKALYYILPYQQIIVMQAKRLHCGLSNSLKVTCRALIL